MSKPLIIFLHNDDLTHPSWYLLDDHASLVYRGDPQKLAALTERDEVTVIVPGEDVLLITANLPKMTRPRLLKALPYAIEEQLTEEIDTLHFATLENKISEEVPTAVVTHAKMQQWLTLLKSWQIKPRAFIPATLTIPYEENSWSLLIHDEMILLRTQLFISLVIDKPNLGPYLDLCLSTATHLPRELRVFNYSSRPFAQEFNAPFPVQEEMIPSGKLLINLAHHSQQDGVINLLQNTHANKTQKFSHFGKLWKWVPYLVATWVFILIWYPLGSYFLLAHHLGQLNAEINKIYKQNFPQASTVIAPKIRMQGKLQKLSASPAENQALILLAKIGKARHETENIEIKRIDFQHHQLTLDLEAKGSEEITIFSEALATEGLKVKQQNANLSGSRITTTLLIE